MARFGDYELQEKIGEGGMAMVYRAVQGSLGRPVAIKVLSRALVEEAEVVDRFNRESVIIARLNHPNIIHVIDRGIADGVPYFAMDFIQGTDLARIIAEGRYGVRQKFDVVIQVCKALAYAHRNGVVHLDIKPANILIDAEGNALVSDFGIARLCGAGEGGDGGLTLGTPSYMSPEQKAGGGDISAASDIYSLGVVMYELFTGRKPVPGVLPSRVDPKIPRALDEIIVGCLRSRPQDRYASADALRDDLLALMQGAHLRQERKASAVEGLHNLRDRFGLLDVIREHRSCAVYLFENRATRQLLVIRKLVGRRDGLAEARLLAHLKHPNVVRIHGTSASGRVSVIAMEYLPGGSLKDRMARVPDWPDALDTLRDVCDGLSFLHRNRLVHGNLRPSNILFGEDGMARISDAGLDPAHADDTQPGNVYAPRGEPKSIQADIFCAGMIFSELLTGALPVAKKGRLVQEYTFRWLPGELRRVIDRMLAEDPAQRPAGMDEVLAVVDELMRSRLSPESTAPGGSGERAPVRGGSVLSRWSLAFGDWVNAALR